jgi:ribonuclease P protein component
MPFKQATLLSGRAGTSPREAWLRKHADYQRVYRVGKRQSLPFMTYFFAWRAPGFSPAPGSEHQAEGAETQPDTQSGNLSLEQPRLGPRIGLTAGRVLGNAVERNRIKRRMREAVRQHRAELTASVDVILHPRRTVLEADFSQIERDVLRAFRAVQAAAGKS